MKNILVSKNGMAAAGFDLIFSDIETAISYANSGDIIKIEVGIY